MPIIKIFVAQRPSPAACAAMAEEIEALCVNCMDARRDAVQLTLLGDSLMLRGAPVLVEVHYRARHDRNAPVMDVFMDALDRMCRRLLGATPRIRCFAIDQATLFARN
ncbi:hypothetical protein ACSFBX_23780 [Variovorax sp. RB2P76]|uniref:hypothetical protein n=1 Tax=Variovorax sp. RB2P76 TaxID=3443736 RepID=UPI003F462580